MDNTFLTAQEVCWGENPAAPVSRGRCTSALRQPSLWRGIAVPAYGIQRHFYFTWTQLLPRNRCARGNKTSYSKAYFV